MHQFVHQWALPSSTTRKTQAWASGEEVDSEKFQNVQTEKETTAFSCPWGPPLLWGQGTTRERNHSPKRELNTSSSSGPISNCQDRRQEEAGPAETSSLEDGLTVQVKTGPEAGFPIRFHELLQ